MLLVAFVIFLALKISAKTRTDRCTYGALTLASLAGLIYYRQNPAVSGGFF